jgi:hypothetical protein
MNLPKSTLQRKIDFLNRNYNIYTIKVLWFMLRFLNVTEKMEVKVLKRRPLGRQEFIALY